jgi:copper chaperone NosL
MQTYSKTSGKSSKLKSVLLIFFSLVLIFISCTRPGKPEPMQLGTDVCANCKMTIVDPKWGAEIISDKGKIYKFDVVECMISYFINEMHKNREKVSSFWTINYLNPGEFINAETAIYFRSGEFHSPMGLNAVSLKKGDDVSKLNLAKQPEKLYWDGMLKAVEAEK